MPGPSEQHFNVDHFLDSRRLGPVHYITTAILLLVMLVDGYDIFVAGAVLPALSEAWHVHPSSLTGVFVAQQAGLLAGVTVTGPLADRIGRRRMLLACLTCFGLMTFAVSFVETPAQLMTLRFISALFFSGALPNCVAMISEIAPKRVRAGLISIVFCGYTGGSYLCAAALRYIIGPFGWQGAFQLGGILPLLLIPIVYFFLPESVRFRATRNPHDPSIARLLMRIDPSLRFTGRERFVLDEAPRKGPTRPVTALFEHGLMRMTLLVWLSYFLAFMVNQLMGNWDTTIFHHVANLPYQHIALMITCRTTAGIIGTATAGFVMDRFGASRSLSFFYFTSALLIGGLAFVDLGSTTALIIFTLLGYTMNSGLGGLNAQAAITYPPRMRVTGVAWGSGIGRLGGMVGPVVGGALLSGTPSTTSIYLFSAMPELLAAIAIFAMAWARSAPPDDKKASASPAEARA